MKKVLILTWSYGGWHNTAASNLEQYYKNKWYDTKTIDIIEFVAKFVAKSSKKFYSISSEEYPKIWETFFNATDFPIFARILYWIKDPIWQPKFNHIIEEYNPDTVISVFPFWNWWIKNYRKKYWEKFKWWIVITDAINIQSFWYVKSKYVDKYFVFDKWTKQEFIEKFDYPEDKVQVSFFPFLKEKFVNKEKIWNKNILILLTWLEYELVDKILSKISWNITILKWRNEEVFETLKLKYWEKFIFLDFLPILDNLKNIDIVIWKPGWAIVCECIATDTILIVPSFFPGQEEGNVQLLQNSETWIYENNPEKILFLIKYLDFTNFLSNFQKIKKDNSCDIIFESLT